MSTIESADTQTEGERALDAAFTQAESHFASSTEEITITLDSIAGLILPNSWRDTGRFAQGRSIKYVYIKYKQVHFKLAE